MSWVPGLPEAMNERSVGDGEDVDDLVGREVGDVVGELVGAPPVTDPRIRPKPITRANMTLYPLTRNAGGQMAFKVRLRPTTDPPDPQPHSGHEWLYVLSGRLRLVLDDHDLVLKPGEAAEFDTEVPHWFGSADDRPVEFLSLFGPRGERIHFRARGSGSRQP